MNKTAQISLSEENLDNLSAFQNAIARELSEVESNIGFNKAMQHPKYVENKLIDHSIFIESLLFNSYLKNNETEDFEYEKLINGIKNG